MILSSPRRVMSYNFDVLTALFVIFFGVSIDIHGIASPFLADLIFNIVIAENEGIYQPILKSFQSFFIWRKLCRYKNEIVRGKIYLVYNLSSCDMWCFLIKYLYGYCHNGRRLVLLQKSRGTVTLWLHRNLRAGIWERRALPMLTMEGLIAVISLCLTAFGLGYAIGSKDNNKPQK